MKNLLCLTLLTILFSSCSEKHEITLNLEMGKDYSQETNLNAIINQSINGQDIEIEMIMNGNMNYHVKSVNTDDFDLEVSYTKLEMQMKMPTMNVAYSSETPDKEDQFSLILSQMVGKSFGVKMSKTGKVISVDNIDDLFSSVFNAFPDLDLATREQMKSQLLDSYGDKAFKGNIEMVSAIFPGKPVSQGDSWEIETLIESTMKAGVVSTYTLKEINEDHYIISGSSVISSLEDGSMETQGVQMKFNIGGDMTSKLKVDKSTGWILDGDVSQTIEGNVKIEAGPNNPEEIEYPISMINTMKVEGK